MGISPGYTHTDFHQFAEPNKTIKLTLFYHFFQVFKNRHIQACQKAFPHTEFNNLTFPFPPPKVATFRHPFPTKVVVFRQNGSKPVSVIIPWFPGPWTVWGHNRG